MPQKRKKAKKEKESKEQDAKPAAGKNDYSFMAGQTQVKVKVYKKEGDKVKTYELEIPRLEEGTMAFLDDVKRRLLREINISHEEALDIRMAGQLRKKFIEIAKKMIREHMPDLTGKKLELISERIVQEMLGLGEMEFLLQDDKIEEICVNGSSEPLWIYHRDLGWMKTNIKMQNENEILNYASSIARNVGRQINIQNPLLDAYLATGDRVNATIYPVSSFGNTITIRKFARKPWTITDMIKTKTISSEVAALIWLAMQYEMSIIVAGGTGSGKTSFLNVISSFIPPNQRIVSIEQTREITLPSDYQWVPMVVRQVASEGKGEVSMLDLMVNSLRMRPDRIIIGEIRRAGEAQVLFEAMHTGHSVYATLHAETMDEAFRRLKNPPINIPAVMLSSLHMIIAMYRDRRLGRRRMFEFGEIVTSGDDISSNLLYKWQASGDKIVKAGNSKKLMNYFRTYTNLSESEINKTLKERKEILDMMVKKNINTVEDVGNIISDYYNNPESVMKKLRKG